MKILISILLILSVPAFGQEKVWTDESTSEQLHEFISIDPSQGVTVTSFKDFLLKLEKKRHGLSEKEFLQLVFTKTHQTYLKKYVPYASFSNLFVDGSYHCLTGTILYSLILNHFGVSHKVIETNYHIFLMAETKDGRILIEATDPQSGFVDSPLAIESRLHTYKQQSIEATNAKASYYQFQFDLFNAVSLDEMRGLLYFNKAVDLFNQNKLEECVTHIVKANALYSSARIDEFTQILLLAIQQSSLEPLQKKDCMKPLIVIRQQAFPAVVVLKTNRAKF